MSIVLVLQLAIAVFVVLFFINWVITLSSQQFKGFRWGDFALIFLVGGVIFFNAGRIQNFATVVPDMVDWMMSFPRAKMRQVDSSLQETRQTVNAVSDYLKDVAQRELDYQMKMDLRK